ncbi:MAG: hypothetical protein IPK31_15760 [Chitinophagaceae bacterium]|nr:hypothetical protein [Chitinophagaceae bacterium]
MKKLLFAGFLLLNSTLFAQKFSGQWSGSFDAKNDSIDRTEYFLELDVNGSTVEGSSTTYFMIGGKRYYTICKITAVSMPKARPSFQKN